VIYESAEPPHGAEDCGQIAAHPRGTAAAAFAGDSHGAAIRESSKGARIGVRVNKTALTP